MGKKMKVLSFIESAVSDDKTRYFLLDPYWDHEAGCVVSTDGRRMHVWRWNKAADDYADQLKAWGLPADRSTYLQAVHELGKFVEKKVDAQYPNWQKVYPAYMPSPKPSDQREKLEGEYFFPDPTKKARGKDIPIFLAKNSLALNLDYLFDLEGWNWIYSKAAKDPANHAVAFTAEGSQAIPGPVGSSLHAVIMPLSLD